MNNTGAACRATVVGADAPLPSSFFASQCPRRKRGHDLNARAVGQVASELSVNCSFPAARGYAAAPAPPTQERIGGFFMAAL